MFRPLFVFIGTRYTRAKRRNHFVSFISLTSMIGLALGVVVMIVVLSVMNGFDHEMRTRVLGMVPHATIEGDAPINDSKGCGGVMRTAPIGLMPSASPQLAFDLGCMAGALTHGHVDGWLPAGMVAAMVRLLMAGESMEHAAEQALTLNQR